MEVLQPYVLGWLVPTVFSALGAAVGYLIGMVRKMRKDADEDKEVQKFTLLTVCRMAIYDDHFSTDEKVETYRMYRKHGGNHDAKKYMTNLLGEDADAYLASHSE